MSPPAEFLPDWGTPSSRSPSKRDVFLVIVLLGLLVLATTSWPADPAHQATGKSRVKWPGASPRQP